jgi:hypothetical protein
MIGFSFKKVFMPQTSQTNPYLNEDDSPLLLRSIVAFVDILGYSELSRREPASLSFLANIRDALRTAFRSLDPNFGAPRGAQRYWMTKTFTDNIVIGLPITFQDGSPELGMVLGRLGEFQLQMTLAGFFVRGAVSVNKIYMDDHIVFGPALIEAYDAERTLACDPRIVLANSAREMRYIQERVEITEIVDHQHDMLLMDTDGQLFLNYLQGVVEFEHDMGYPITEYLEKHRDHLLGRLTSFINQPRIWAKYYWCATYHNYFCMGRSDFNEFKISLDSVTPQPQRISGT